MSGTRRLFSLIVVSLLLIAAMAQAQVTTGTLAGDVIIDGEGTALPGVTIEVVHVPTGTRYSAVSGSNGRYLIPNMRPGGPYRITGSLEGMRTAEVNNINVSLGTTTEVPLALQLSTVAETIVVTASADEIINPNRTGSSSSVAEEQIESLPTVNRSLQDFARTNPYFRVDASDTSSTRINVAGRNNRYNQIQIDGAVNNDLFGLADTGTPGGQTDAQPVSLDAIQSLQLVVSPYDVRQGGFTGGGINAVTRSGTNDFEGSIFGTTRDKDMVGEGPFERDVANFDQDQYGGRLGGPLMRDKLFFFLSGEINRRKQPTDVSADGSTGIQFNAPADAARLRDVLMERYDYDPGTLGDFPGQQDSDLLFGRLDWNVNDSHQLTLRHNFVDATKDVIADRSTTRYRFSSAIYTIADETNSTVAQLNSVFGSSAFNEARIGLQTIKDVRNTPVIFPTVEIGGTGPRNGALHVGTERFSGANALDQDVLEVTDDFTMLMGNHTVTVGTHNEFFKFKNLFLQSFYGYYYFPTLAAFEAGTPQEYGIAFATGDDPRRAPKFSAGQYGLYVSDQWRVNNSLSFTAGLRADKPTFGDNPSFNPIVQTAIGYNTSDTASESVIISPRIGFNWQPGADGTQQVRGGIGIFAGRTPYVWISNAYANTGIESQSLSCLGTCPRPAFNPDPFNQPRNLGAGGTLNVDMIDPDFEFPRVMRATLGYDRELFWGVRSTIEGVLSQTQEDVFYYNVNRHQVGNSPLDGRPTFAPNSTALNTATLLSNTSKGEETTATLQLTRPFSNGLSLSANYAWQDAESAFDATSSQATSNFGFRHTKGDIFEQDLSTSAFEVTHRINASASYDLTTGPLGHTFALYYNVQSGRPYSIMMGGDPNTDGSSTNDLLFVPAHGAIVQSQSGQVIPNGYAALAHWLSYAGIDPNSGRILDRYESNEPYSRQLDFHYGLEVPIGSFRPELTFDVLNLLNMFDNDSGVVRFVSNQNYTVIGYRGIDAATGLPIYRESSAGGLFDPADPTNPEKWKKGTQFTTADLRSRWQARVGLRLSF